jgi:hypothetical protein
VPPPPPTLHNDEELIILCKFSEREKTRDVGDESWRAISAAWLEGNIVNWASESATKVLKHTAKMLFFFFNFFFIATNFLFFSSSFYYLHKKKMKKFLVFRN